MKILVIEKTFNQASLSLLKKLSNHSIYLITLSKDISETDISIDTLITMDSKNEFIFLNDIKNYLKLNSFDHIIGNHSQFNKAFFPYIFTNYTSNVFSFDLEKKLLKKNIFSGKSYTESPLTQSFTVSIDSSFVIEKPIKSFFTHHEKILSIEDLSFIITEIKEEQKTNFPKLEEASIIVSGGRALASKENFKILEELALVLKGAVGASRAAVDAGYIPYEFQIGQTGKTVNPLLYIACGISGSIQHFAGMKSSKYILAINLDPKCPMVIESHFAIIGDLFQIVPQLTSLLKSS